MNEDHLVTSEETMAEDDYAFFMAAMRYKIDQTGMKQRELAGKVGKSHQWFNAVFKRRSVRGKEAKASADLQKAVAEAFGYSFIEFLQLGKRITMEHLPVEEDQDQKKPEPTTPLPRQVPGVEAKHVNPMDVLQSVSVASASLAVASTAVSTLVDQHQKLDGRMRFWRAIFDELPIPTLIIKDEIVIYQNVKSSSWGNITGGTLCDSCACPEDCKQRKDCPVHQAMETRNPVAGYQHIASGFYKVNITPMRLHDHEYFIIVATESDVPEGRGDRRSGGDRRSED